MSTPTSERPDCTSPRRLLAASPIASVEACRCGVIHLHLGAMSLRFTRESLDVLHGTLARAACSLELDAQQRAFGLALVPAHEGMS